MAIYIGSNNISPLYLGSTEIGKAYLGYVQVYGPSQPFLPAHTIRCKFSTGYTPRMGDSNTLVDAGENIWDIYVSSNNWNYLFYIDLTSMSYQNPYLLKVIAANTTGVTSMWCMFEGCVNLTSVPWMDTSSVTSMGYMFCRCPKLTSVPLFDTSSATNFSYMLTRCTSLTTIPLLDTSHATDVSGMFSECYNIESGALDLYNQMSTQTNPPTSHQECFTFCGSNTVTGAAELAQIPASWGGLGT